MEQVFYPLVQSLGKSLGVGKAVDKILHELFGRFNFTVTESTPLDVEVAVDPEMLGKVWRKMRQPLKSGRFVLDTRQHCPT